jgi:hypothetical protein
MQEKITFLAKSQENSSKGTLLPIPAMETKKFYFISCLVVNI